MDSTVVILSVGCVLISLIIIVLSFMQKRKSSLENVAAGNQQPRAVPVDRRQPADLPRRAGRNIRARMRAVALRQEEEAIEEEDDPLADEIALPEGKLGAKKRKKLELKAERRIQRERELEEREERKEKEKATEEKRKKDEEIEKQLELQKEAEEKALKEEKEKQDLEEYLKLKEQFAIEGEGFDENEDIEGTQKLQEFIDYIKEQKVVLLEDLAIHFKLKTQDAINRVQDLLTQELLIGVIDDRGKFIYITKEELESIATFIKQQGRVSISDLAESSNTLINLLPDTAVTIS